MAANLLPDQATLLKLLRYEPETGKLYWRERTPDMFYSSKMAPESICLAFNNSRADKEAFTATMINGYKIGAIGHKSMYAHRVIWAIMTGSWPTQDIDHINGKRDDNRWHNLREVSRGENLRNMSRSSKNTTGCVGVYRGKRPGTFYAQIKVRNKTVGLGSFETMDEAIRARKAAERQIGFHPNHGRAGPL